MALLSYEVGRQLPWSKFNFYNLGDKVGKAARKPSGLGKAWMVGEPGNTPARDLPFMNLWGLRDMQRLLCVYAEC